MKSASSFRLLSLAALFIVVGCAKDEPYYEHKLSPYQIEVPPDFPVLAIPPDNQPYVERIALGRRLYYDAVLSNDGRACASCHWQSRGFSSAGGSATPILPHFNMGWKEQWMWDGREEGSLEDVMLFEVEEFFNTDLGKLNQHPDYPSLFKEAYNVEEISSTDVARALAQFVRIIISADSKFDRVQRGMAAFSDEEAKGYLIFNSEKGSCYHCHTPPLFTDNGLHNIGLDSSYARPENRGYYRRSLDSADLGRMRTPSLRNLAYRSSFMHDGRFTALDQVLEHYNQGVVESPTLDPIMIKGGNRIQLQLSATELGQLQAFLLTLTDSALITNPALSAPH